MLRKSSLFMSVLFLAASLAAVSPAQAVLYSASLVDDFTLAENSTTSTWSFGQEDNTTNPITVNLYTNNTRTANDLWGTGFAAPPTMWSSNSGYWGIGKNTSGVTQVNNVGNVSWAPGEVFFHPQLGYPVGRLDIIWTAPFNMTIDANWTFTSETPEGDGVGLQLSKISGGVMTTLLGFGAGGVTVATTGNPPERVNTPIVGSLSSYDVLAGDKLLFQIDCWPTAGGDITSASITIQQIPEPSVFVLLTAGLVGLLAFAWRKRK